MTKKKKYKVSDFLNEGLDKNKEENKTEIKDESTVNNKEENSSEEKIEPKTIKKENYVKDGIPKSELQLIDKGLEDAVHTLRSVNETHQKAIETKKKEKEEKDRIKKERDIGDHKEETKTKEKKKKNIFDIETKTKRKNRSGKLSKIQKLRNISKRSRGVSFPLFESNYIIKMYGLNTLIKISDSYNVLLSKEFGFFQSIEKLKTIYEHSDFIFKDGERINFETFLEITSPGDLPLLNMIWSFANTEGKPINNVLICQECGHENPIEENLEDVFENSFSKLLEEFDYDQTSPIDELQKETVMGKMKEIKYTDEENEIEYTVELSAPNLKKYMFIDDQVRSLIIDKLREYIPIELLRTNDKDKKIRYLWNNKRNELNTIHETYTELLLFIDILTIKDKKDTKDNFGTLQFSTLHDDVNDIQEAIDTIPDKFMVSITETVEEDLISGIEYNFKGEPVKCSECGKWIKNENKNVNDLLFFTIGSLIQRKLSDRNRN